MVPKLRNMETTEFAILDGFNSERVVTRSRSQNLPTLQSDQSSVWVPSDFFVYVQPKVVDMVSGRNQNVVELDGADKIELEASVVEDRAMKDPKERDTEMPQLSEPESPWTAEEDDWCPGERRMPALKRVYPPHAEKRHLAPRANDEALEAALSLCLLSQQEVPPMAQPQPPLKEDKGVQCKPQKCSKSVQCNLEKRQRLENEESDSCTDHDTSLE
ncbi:hypothetical protein AAG570_003537 [Ranatra chinensis]|uniref:Prolactin receptor n=1 Tax=Ranatra chinensis TaxID=642074 RepID=A0ABD0Y4B0_9HEMI